MIRIKESFGFLTALCLGVLAAGTANAADIGNGQRIYMEHCVVCHGPDGRPTQPATPDFRRSEGLIAPDSTLRNSIRRGVRVMPGYDGILTDQELADVVAFLRTLQR